MSNLTNNAVRTAVLNMCFGDAGLAIHGVNTENVLTANAVEMSVNGVWNTLAAQAEVDISGLTFYNGDGDVLTAAPVVQTAYEAKFVLARNSADTIICCCGFEIATADTEEPDWPVVPDGYTPFGGIKVVNATGSDFTIGTTGLDTANITDTYYDLCNIPPRSV